MKTQRAFGLNLKELRKEKSVTQEDFSTVSSRTYVRMLERGQKNPSLEKVEDLARVLKVHPLSLLCLTYLHTGEHERLDDLFAAVRSDLADIARTR